MSGLVDALLIIAVVVLVIVRQFRARRITDGQALVDRARRPRSSWRCASPGLLDTHHRRRLSALLLGAELLVGLATGAGWAWTTRMWTEAGRHRVEQEHQGQRGRLGRRHRRCGPALYGARRGSGRAPGQFRPAARALAVTLLVRSGVLIWRAQSLRPARRRSRGVR